MAEMIDQTQAPQQDVQKLMMLIKMYRSNPGAFRDDEVKELKAYADMAGIPFSVPFSPARAAGRAVGELADTLTLGLMPDDWMPEAMNSGEEIAGTVGSLASLLVPFAGPTAWGAKAAKYAGKNILPQLIRRAGQTAGAAEGAGKMAKAGAMVGDKLGKLGQMLNTTKGQTRFLQGIGGATTGLVLGQPLEGNIDLGNMLMGGLLGAALPAKVMGLEKYAPGQYVKGEVYENIATKPINKGAKQIGMGSRGAQRQLPPGRSGGAVDNTADVKASAQKLADEERASQFSAKYKAKAEEIRKVKAEDGNTYFVDKAGNVYKTEVEAFLGKSGNQFITSNKEVFDAIKKLREKNIQLGEVTGYSKQTKDLMNALLSKDPGTRAAAIKTLKNNKTAFEKVKSLSEKLKNPPAPASPAAATTPPKDPITQAAENIQTRPPAAGEVPMGADVPPGYYDELGRTVAAGNAFPATKEAIAAEIEALSKLASLTAEQMTRLGTLKQILAQMP